MSFTVQWTSIPSSYRSWAGEFLDDHPVQTSVVATNVGRAAQGFLDDGYQFGMVFDGDEGISAMLWTPPRPLFVTNAASEACVAIGESVANRGFEISGITAPKCDVGPILEGMGKADAGRHLLRSVTLYDLPRDPDTPPGVKGSMRPAKHSDLPLLQQWVDAFLEEAIPEETRVPTDAETLLRGMTVWEVDEKPMSMAFASPDMAGVQRISWVYTPKEHRGKKYASALVGRVSLDIIDEERRPCLYTDNAHSASAALYKRLGYRELLVSETWMFDQDDADDAPDDIAS